MKILFTNTVGLLIAVSLFAQPSAKINLALNLKVGKTYTLNQKSTQDISQLVMGTEQNIKTEISGVNSFLVKASTDSSYTVELRFKKMLFKMTSPLAGMEFNSEKPIGEDDLFGQVMLSFIKNPYTMEELFAELPGLSELHILPYHSIAKGKYQRLGIENLMDGIAEPTSDAVAKVASRFTGIGLVVKIGG